MIHLGTTVQDRISGFQGIVTARTDYLYASPRLQVSRQSLHAEPGDDRWFDEAQLEAVDTTPPESDDAEPLDALRRNFEARWAEAGRRGPTPHLTNFVEPAPPSKTSDLPTNPSTIPGTLRSWLNDTSPVTTAFLASPPVDQASDPEQPAWPDEAERDRATSLAPPPQSVAADRAVSPVDPLPGAER